MAETTISWTSYVDKDGKVVPGYTFNPWIGCTKVKGDPACAHCYAERENHLFRWCGGWGDEYPRRLTGEANWRKVKTWNRKAEKEGNHPLVFVASLADVFDPHPSILQEWVGNLFTLMENCKNLRFLVLTKRIERVSSIVPAKYWIDNPHIGLGFTAANQHWFDDRIHFLLNIPAAMRFVSIEPMTGPVSINDNYRVAGHLGLVICGGESMGGSMENRKKARPVNPQWLHAIREECKFEHILFHFKQWGEWSENGELVGRENSGCKLDGVEYKEFPRWFVGG